MRKRASGKTREKKADLPIPDWLKADPSRTDDLPIPDWIYEPRPVYETLRLIRNYSFRAEQIRRIMEAPKTNWTGDCKAYWANIHLVDGPSPNTPAEDLWFVVEVAKRSDSEKIWWARQWARFAGALRATLKTAGSQLLGIGPWFIDRTLLKEAPKRFLEN